MKKGFTLVELIGVIVIVGLIILVGVPAMTKTLKKTNEDEHQRVLTDLYLAAENYIQVNRKNFPTLNEAGGETYISLNELKNAGYLRANIINPGTEEKFDYNTAIKVFRNADATLDYEYNENYYGVDSYISDGLIVHYDALNNQGIGIFDEDASEWKDLSGNNHDGATNGAKFQGDTVYYDGVDDYTLIESLANYSFTSGQTLEININVIGTVSSDGSSALHLIGNWHTSGSGFRFISATSKFDAPWYINGAYTWNVAGGKNVKTGTLYTVIGTYDGSTVKLYLNGDEVSSLAISGTIATSTVPIAIGGNPNTSGFDSFSEVSVQNVLIYNRALTADEVKYNYKIDKLRFNMQ